ncbi:MAG: DUF2283 domain-containing protein [Deinococcota bacterium]
MTLQIDKDADALYIELVKDVQAAETLELSLDIYVDVDVQGNVIGIEMLNFSEYERLEIPSFNTPAKLDDVKAFGAQFA